MTTDHATRRDTAVADVLAAIDAVTAPRCRTCDTELSPDAPSEDWCSESCAVAWLRATTQPLPDTDDQEETGLSRRIVTCGTPDRMDIWLQWGDGPDQRAELAEWLAANNLPVNDIPVDSTIYVEGGQVTVDVLRRGDNGGIPVDPAGNPYRDTLTVPLVHEWTARPDPELVTYQERPYHLEASTGDPLEHWAAGHRRQMIETTTAYDPDGQRVTGDGTGTPLPLADAVEDTLHVQQAQVTRVMASTGTRMSAFLERIRRIRPGRTR